MTGVAAARGIRAVTFDAGGTLLEPWPSVGQVYADAARAAGFGDFGPSGLEKRFRTTWSARGHFDYSRAAWAAVVRSVFTELTPEAADPRLFAAIWNRFTEAGAWQVFPDVAPCLAALKELGLPLAVVSNWDERLHPVLRRVGLADAFEFILPSVEVAAPKPDPRLFAAAAARFGLPPAAILHVGDSAREDVAGAQGAGFQALLLARADNVGRPDALGSLTELPAKLASD